MRQNRKWIGMILGLSLFITSAGILSVPENVEAREADQKVQEQEVQTAEEDASGIKENIRLEIVSRIWNSRGFKEFQEAERGVIITEFYKLLIDMFDAYEEKKENLKEEHL